MSKQFSPFNLTRLVTDGDLTMKLKVQREALAL